MRMEMKLKKSSFNTWKIVLIGTLFIIAILVIKTFYLGFYYYEDIRPDGKYKIVVSYIPSLRDIEAVPPGDKADKYVWVRLYSQDGDQLNETLMLLNSISTKLWGNKEVFVSGDLVWKLPNNQ